MSFTKSVELKTKKNKTYKANIEIFETAGELVRVNKARKNTDRSFHKMWEEGEVSESFCGVKTYGEALEYLETGYAPVVKDLMKADKLEVRGSSKRFKFENGVEGFAPIVPLALMGVPNSMINSRIKPIKAKVIDVYYDATCSAITSTEEILEAGKYALSAIISLEKEGYRFNLYAFQAYQRDLSGDMVAVKLKGANQPLDIQRVSFPMTHPAFFRVIGFDWYGKFPKGVYRSGYGQALYYNDELDIYSKEFAKTMFGDNAVYISGQKLIKDLKHRNEKGKLKHVKELLTSSDNAKQEEEE